MYNPYYNNEEDKELNFNKLLQQHFMQNNNELDNNSENYYPVNMYDNRYANGGHVKETAQKLQKMGRYGDTILAHINPFEAMILKEFGGSGTINPRTGLREYWGRFFKNPLGTIKKIGHNISHGKIHKPLGDLVKNAGTVLGAVYGGPMGAAAAGAASRAVGSAIQGKKNFLNEALMGGITGLGANMLLGNPANLATNAGKGMLSTTAGAIKTIPQNVVYNVSKIGNALGFGGGNANANLGEKLATLGLGNLKFNNMPTEQDYARYYNGLGVSAGDEISDLNTVLDRYYQKKYAPKEEKGFWDKLTNNFGDYLSKPESYLTLAKVAGDYMMRPKEMTPEREANLEKRKVKAMRLTPQELADQEAYNLAVEQSLRRIMKEKYLPEERISTITPRYVKTHTPEEYQNTGKWLSYYDNPELTGNPFAYAEGGHVEHQEPEYYTEEEITIPSRFLNGFTDGKADQIPALLSDGEYVNPALNVAILGNGNNNSGALKLDRFNNDLKKFFNKLTHKQSPFHKSVIEYFELV